MGSRDGDREGGGAGGDAEWRRERKVFRKGEGRECFEKMKGGWSGERAGGKEQCKRFRVT